MPRCSTSYCSLTSRPNAFSVIAMNGISYGTSNSGKPVPVGLLDHRLRDGLVLEAGAEPEAGQVVVHERAARTRAARRRR